MLMTSISLTFYLAIFTRLALVQRLQSHYNFWSYRMLVAYNYNLCAKANLVDTVGLGLEGQRD